MRKPTKTEIQLLTILLQKANMNIVAKELLVESMDDGGMGSLRIGENHNSRKFGKIVSEYSFKDDDGIEILASLNVDENDDLYELDIFKSNFERSIFLKQTT